MNYDIDPVRPYVPGRREDPFGQDRNARPDQNQNLFARLRNLNLNNISRSSLSSLFASGTPDPTPVQDERPSCSLGVTRPTQDTGANVKDSSRSTTPTGRSHNARFPEVKRMLCNFARARQLSPSDYTELLDTPLAYDTGLATGTHEINPFDAAAALEAAYMPPAAPDSGNLSETPPLTPDCLDPLVLSPAEVSEYEYLHEENSYLPEIAGDEAFTRPHSMEIKQGKMPERPAENDLSPTDELGSYLDSPNCDRIIQIDACEPQDTMPTIAATDGEWYGLEYTLALSSRERGASNSSSSVGEHSKSRESWAAIHEGSVHPFYEEEEYHQWMNWHHYLDKQDERRKHHKGLEFKARAKDLAWYYLEERRTAAAAYWQMEDYGIISREMQEHWTRLTKHRPDPYYPRVKHNLAWQLKTSRSVVSLRELRPLPDLTM